MNIFEEISGFVGEDFLLAKDICVFMFGFKKVYITGYSKLGELSAEKVVVFSSKKKIVVDGSDLIVKFVEKKELLILGTIKNVSVE